MAHALRVRECLLQILRTAPRSMRSFLYSTALRREKDAFVDDTAKNVAWFSAEAARSKGGKTNDLFLHIARRHVAPSHVDDDTEEYAHVDRMLFSDVEVSSSCFVDTTPKSDSDVAASRVRYELQAVIDESIKATSVKRKLPTAREDFYALPKFCVTCADILGTECAENAVLYDDVKLYGVRNSGLSYCIRHYRRVQRASSTKKVDELDDLTYNVYVFKKYAKQIRARVANLDQYADNDEREKLLLRRIESGVCSMHTCSRKPKSLSLCSMHTGRYARAKPPA